VSAYDPKRISRVCALSLDDFGGVVLRINDRNHHDWIGLFYFSSSNDRRFFAAK